MRTWRGEATGSARSPDRSTFTLMWSRAGEFHRQFLALLLLMPSFPMRREYPSAAWLNSPAATLLVRERP